VRILSLIIQHFKHEGDFQRYRYRKVLTAFLLKVLFLIGLCAFENSTQRGKIIQQQGKTKMISFFTEVKYGEMNKTSQSCKGGNLIQISWQMTKGM